MTIEPNGYKALQDENEKLKEKIDSLRQDLQNRCDRCIELNNKNKKLKQRINNLVSENVKLQNDLVTDQLQTEELEYKLLQRQEEITELKTKRYEAHVMQKRLMKILIETSD